MSEGFLPIFSSINMSSIVSVPFFYGFYVLFLCFNISLLKSSVSFSILPPAFLQHPYNLWFIIQFLIDFLLPFHSVCFLDMSSVVHLDIFLCFFILVALCVCFYVLETN